MSPEFFNNSVKIFTPKIDVWALNTCLYLFLTGNFYFYRPDPKEMEKLILHTEFIIKDPLLESLSMETRELLTLGYKKNPNERPSMSEYIMHPGFKKFHEKYKKFIPQTSNTPKMSLTTSLETMKLSVIEGDNELYLRYFCNFRNNNLVFYKLSYFFEDYGISLCAAFYLIKKQIQNLLAIIYYLKLNLVPELSYFKKIKITTELWSKFRKGPWSSKISALYSKDLNFLLPRLTTLGKYLLDSGKTPDFDLNTDHSNNLIVFCNKLREKSDALKEKIDLNVFSKNIGYLQKILVYEKYDSSQIVLY